MMKSIAANKHQRKQLIQGYLSSIHFSLLFGNALLQHLRQSLHSGQNTQLIEGLQ